MTGAGPVLVRTLQAIRGVPRAARPHPGQPRAPNRETMRVTARLKLISKLTAFAVASALLPGVPAVAADRYDPYTSAFATVVTAPGQLQSVQFTAAVGKADYLIVTSNPTSLTFDGNYPITPAGGCAHVAGDLTKVTCPHGEYSYYQLRINVADGDDTVLLRYDKYVDIAEVRGGSGNDVLSHTPAANSYVNVRLYGEAGNDQIEDRLIGLRRTLVDGGDGDDYLYCERTSGPQLSSMVGGGGADTFAGSCYVDYTARTTAVRVSVDDIADDGSPGEGDNVQTSIVGVLGGSGNDVLFSTVSAMLEGNGGADTLFGSDFDDILLAADGTGTDIVYAGYGHDKCKTDLGDTVAGCEQT
ncbi:hypothetical protein AB0B66_42610 [Catellatospora sp. NPDC049111]|uniref:hypothetical protein n=1 Tax=Catellatospora sp. NPDC049111 TaxID=3155271 RepID=UPI0033C7066E